jgi:HPt (histidine-containing phosphotransfer) domain-containing protein
VGVLPDHQTSNLESDKVSIFNYKKMLNQLGGNVQLSKKIIQSATIETPKFIDHLFESIQEENTTQVKNIIHTMKGLIGQIGGDELENQLKTFDERLRNGGSMNNSDVELIDQLYKKLIDEIYRQSIIDF